MPRSALRRARARMILVPVACACLAAVAGCGAASTSAAVLATSPPPQMTTAAPGAQAAVSTPVSTPASSATAAPDDGSSGGNAVVNMKDGQGDAYTESFTFGAPEPESGVPDAVDGLQACQLGVAIPARNLVIPVRITTTLTTSVQTQIPIEMDEEQFSSDDPDAGIPGDVVYQTTSGDQCATDSPGADVTLSQGQSATTQAWIVLQQAITPAYPDGDQAQLGVNFIYFGASGPSDVTSAQGTAICGGDPQTAQMYSPPFLDFAGDLPAGEGCDGSYTAPPG